LGLWDYSWRDVAMTRILDFIFYRSLRVGKHGRPFLFWKFRTMVKGAEKMGSFSVAEKDWRIRPIGRILRKTHLDELPNLWNVLKGDMALFGPRPEVPHYVNKMPPAVRRVVLSVKPGCLSRATIAGLNEGRLLNNAQDPDDFYEKVIWPKKLKHQCEEILRIKL